MYPHLEQQQQKDWGEGKCTYTHERKERKKEGRKEEIVKCLSQIQ
jgi:hypothetical protein